MECALYFNTLLFLKKAGGFKLPLITIGGLICTASLFTIFILPEERGKHFCWKPTSFYGKAMTSRSSQGWL